MLGQEPKFQGKMTIQPSHTVSGHVFVLLKQLGQEPKFPGKMTITPFLSFNTFLFGALSADLLKAAAGSHGGSRFHLSMQHLRPSHKQHLTHHPCFCLWKVALLYRQPQSQCLRPFLVAGDHASAIWPSFSSSSLFSVRSKCNARRLSVEPLMSAALTLWFVQYSTHAATASRCMPFPIKLDMAASPGNGDACNHAGRTWLHLSSLFGHPKDGHP